MNEETPFTKNSNFYYGAWEINAAYSGGSTAQWAGCGVRGTEAAPRLHRFCTTALDTLLLRHLGVVALLGLAAVYYGLFFYFVLRFSRSW
jgi:hypothetical protein